MTKQYIENNWLWAKKQKEISKLIERQYDSLSVQEKLELAYDKYFKQEKISYDEYVMLLMTNDEIWFGYKNTQYQVIHESNEITAMFITEYNGKQKVSERSEVFSSIMELLNKFRIDNMPIMNIWNDVTFD